MLACACLGFRGYVVGQAACSKSTSSKSTPCSKSTSLRRCTRAARLGLNVELLEDRTVPSAVIGTGTGLTGSYFDNQDLIGSAALTRIDPTINFNWSTKSPAASVPDNHFSVMWNGVVQAPETGTYTFTTSSDDGIRLMINGQTLINNWTVHSDTINSATIKLTAGQKYMIELQYFQNTGGAIASCRGPCRTAPTRSCPSRRLYRGTPGAHRQPCRPGDHRPRHGPAHLPGDLSGPR